MMFLNPVELISFGTSNSLAVFCFFNMIIAILLVGSRKPSSHFSSIVNDPNFKKKVASFHGEWNFSVETEEEQKRITTIEDEEERQDDEEDDDASRKRIEKENEPYVSITMTADEEEEQGEEDDDALRKRVEEFIEKINRERKAENLRSMTYFNSNSDR